MSRQQGPAKLSSSLRWNASHFQILIPTAAQTRLNRAYWGLAITSVFGVWLADQSISSSWRLIVFGLLILMAVWTWSLVVVWLLGLRSGWLVDDNRLVIQGAIRKRSFESHEIRALSTVSGLQELSWTAITTQDGEVPFIALGIPVADIPRILSSLGLSEDEFSDEARSEEDLVLARDQSDRAAVAPASFLGRLRWMLGIERRPATEGEALVRRARAGSGMNLTTDDVGLVRGLMLADSLDEADSFGEVCGPGVVRGLAEQIDDIEGLARTEQILDRLFVYFEVLREREDFETGQLMVAMGEDAAPDRSPAGDLMSELIDAQPGLVGIENPDLVAPGSVNNTQALAWACLAIARLGRVGQVPSLEDLPAWGIVRTNAAGNGS